MNVVIKRLPGFRDPAEFRLMFVNAPGERPSLEHRVKSTEDLRRFLHTLAQPEHVVSRVVGELESSFGATTSIGSLRIDSGELRSLLRMQGKEARQPGEIGREACTARGRVRGGYGCV